MIAGGDLTSNTSTSALTGKKRKVEDEEDDISLFPELDEEQDEVDIVEEVSSEAAAVEEEGEGEGESPATATNDEYSDLLSKDSKMVPRSYQLGMLKRALENNTIVMLETGTGKTLVAVMLIDWFARRAAQNEATEAPDPQAGTKPKKKARVFLNNTVALVHQQARVIAENTDHKVESYVGHMGIDEWRETRWRHKWESASVQVMTHQILLNALRAGFIHISDIDLLIFDECHHARGNHPYSLVMREFYDHCPPADRPHIFGMTASPLNAQETAEVSANHLQAALDSNLCTVDLMADSMSMVARATSVCYEYALPPAYEPTPLTIALAKHCSRSTALQAAFKALPVTMLLLGPFGVDQMWHHFIHRWHHKLLQSSSVTGIHMGKRAYVSKLASQIEKSQAKGNGGADAGVDAGAGGDGATNGNADANDNVIEDSDANSEDIGDADANVDSQASSSIGDTADRASGDNRIVMDDSDNAFVAGSSAGAGGDASLKLDCVADGIGSSISIGTENGISIDSTNENGDFSANGDSNIETNAGANANADADGSSSDRVNGAADEMEIELANHKDTTMLSTDLAKQNISVPQSQIDKLLERQTETMCLKKALYIDHKFGGDALTRSAVVQSMTSSISMLGDSADNEAQLEAAIKARAMQTMPHLNPNNRRIAWDDVKNDLTPQVNRLLGILYEWKDRPDELRAIVFTYRRLTAILLVYIIARIKEFEFVKVDVLLGAASKAKTPMTRHIRAGSAKLANQMTLADFGRGQLNLLVATQVAEEGVDIQPCNLVIRFELPKTATSMIQSRGRARKKGSLFIVMVPMIDEEQGSGDEEDGQYSDSEVSDYSTDMEVDMDTSDDSDFEAEDHKVTIATLFDDSTGQAEMEEAPTEVETEASLAEVPADSPLEVMSETKLELPVETSAEMSAEEPTESLMDTSTEMIVETPSDLPAEMSAEISSGVPVGATVEAPGDVPAEMPSKAPNEAPGSAEKSDLTEADQEADKSATLPEVAQRPIQEKIGTYTDYLKLVALEECLREWCMQESQLEENKSSDGIVTRSNVNLDYGYLLRKNRLIEYTEDMPEDDTKELWMEGKDRTGRVYTVISTKARITYLSAVPIIHHYVQMLPQDPFFALTPMFAFEESSRYEMMFTDWKKSKKKKEKEQKEEQEKEQKEKEKEEPPKKKKKRTPRPVLVHLYKCTVTFPSNAAIRQVVGPFMPNKKLSKQVAAYRAAKKLHQMGAIDDNLLPVAIDGVGKNLKGRPGRSTGIRPGKKAAGTQGSVKEYDTAIPRQFIHLPELDTKSEISLDDAMHLDEQDSKAKDAMVVDSAEAQPPASSESANGSKPMAACEAPGDSKSTPSSESAGSSSDPTSSGPANDKEPIAPRFWYVYKTELKSVFAATSLRLILATAQALPENTAVPLYTAQYSKNGTEIDGSASAFKPVFLSRQLLDHEQVHALASFTSKLLLRIVGRALVWEPSDIGILLGPVLGDGSGIDFDRASAFFKDRVAMLKDGLDAVRQSPGRLVLDALDFGKVKVVSQVIDGVDIYSDLTGYHAALSNEKRAEEPEAKKTPPNDIYSNDTLPASQPPANNASVSAIDQSSTHSDATTEISTSSNKGSDGNGVFATDTTATTTTNGINTAIISTTGSATNADDSKRKMAKPGRRNWVRTMARWAEERRIFRFLPKISDATGVPLLKVKDVNTALNYLQVVFTQSLPPQVAAETEILYPDSIYSSPLFCAVEPLTLDDIYNASLIPSFLTRLEQVLLAEDIKDLLGLDISTDLVRRAITAKSSGMDVNYERLETLGDSVLKFIVSTMVFINRPNDHEGLLSAVRDSIVNNANLYRLGRQHGLPEYVISQMFSKRDWRPPGMGWKQLPFVPAKWVCVPAFEPAIPFVPGRWNTPKSADSSSSKIEEIKDRGSDAQNKQDTENENKPDGETVSMQRAEAETETGTENETETKTGTETGTKTETEAKMDGEFGCNKGEEPKNKEDEAAASRQETETESKGDSKREGNQDGEAKDRQRTEWKKKRPDTREFKTTRPLSDKAVADIVESMLGAAVLHGGLECALDAARALGVVKEMWSSWSEFGNVWNAKIKERRERMENLKQMCAEQLARIDQDDSAEDLLKEMELDKEDVIYGRPSLFAPFTLPNKPGNQVDIASSRWAEQIEGVIGYQFKNRMLLVEALTHCSNADLESSSYQRLEYLGDAVLDYMVTKRYYDYKPELSPHRMTLVKHVAVSNDVLGLVVFCNKLHTYVRHNSEILVTALYDYELQLERARNTWRESSSAADPDNDEQAQSHMQPVDSGIEDAGGLAQAVEDIYKDIPPECWKLVQAPKVLGDIFESLLGAVYVDSGMDFDVASEMYRHLLCPFLDRFVDSGKLTLNPIIHTLLVCQAWGCQSTSWESRPNPNLLEFFNKYICELKVHKKTIAVGMGETPRHAKYSVASEFLGKVGAVAPNTLYGNLADVSKLQPAEDSSAEGNESTDASEPSMRARLDAILKPLCTCLEDRRKAAAKAAEAKAAAEARAKGKEGEGKAAAAPAAPAAALSANSAPNPETEATDADGDVEMGSAEV
ncbi:Dicer-like protein 1 [Dipsacomyces acuminosporus]|nr:Dicer-like protein 1 [Dipsacomyces acuminosporus]